MPGATLIQFGGPPGAGDDAAVAPGTGPSQGRICPTCRQRFSGREARFCPFDGELLELSEWDPSNDPLLGTVVDNRYEVVGVLGEGGMGTVYRVRHKTLERPLALKALRRDLCEDADLPVRFIQEAKAAAAVQHPNVVQITDFGTLSTGQPYFVMELLEGASLSTLLREGPMAPGDTIEIVTQVAQALAVAHAAGVIHRDLKPDNIHVRRMGKHRLIKVLDFGLAKVAGTSRLTRAGMVFGTPHYMSPEQAAGELSDHRVDVYALGVMMYEMLTGRLPFEADSFTGVLAKNMYMDPPKPSEVVGAPLGPVEDIVVRCMAKKPADRYASMTELIADLERLAHELPPATPGLGIDEPPSDDLGMAVPDGLPGRPRWLWPVVLGGGVIVVALGLWAIVAAGRSKDPESARVPAPTPSLAPSSLSAAAPAVTQENPAPEASKGTEPEPQAVAPASTAAHPTSKGKPRGSTEAAPKPPSTREPKPKATTSVGGTEIINPWQ